MKDSKHFPRFFPLAPSPSFKFPGSVTVLLALGLLLGSSLQAQWPDFFPERSSNLPPEDARKLAETIERALHEAASEDPARRVGAIMLLGKYNTPEATAAVLEALSDTNPQVRRAAAVSFLEDVTRSLETSTGSALLARIGDEDVEIRRTISFHLPRILRAAIDNRSRLPANFLFGLLQAFADPDVSVRRNMVAAQAQINLNLPPSLWTLLLRDTDAEVAARALPLAARDLDSRDFAEALAPTLKGSDPRWQRAVAVELGNSFSTPRSLEILRQLAQSDHPLVAKEAFVATFRLTPETHALANLLDQARNNDLHPDTLRRFVNGLLALETDQCLRALQQLLAVRDPQAREEIVSTWLSLLEKLPQESAFLPLLQDDSRMIRMRAVNFLIQFASELPESWIHAVARNPHAEVRRTGLTIAARIDPGRAFDLLLELFLDPDDSLRRAAFSAILNQRLGDWESLARDALLDPDDSLRTHAVHRLLAQKGNPQVRTILSGFARENPSDPLVPIIRAQLP